MSISSSSRGRRGLPRGPHGLTPSEVAQSQRERLLAAMAQAIAERGYTATPVSEVIERAGVSRKTFYVHFQDRRDCLVAAYDQAAATTLANVKATAQKTESPRAKLPAMITALCESAAQDPAAFRLQVVEIAAAGQAALLSREQLIVSIGALLRTGLESESSAPPVPLMGLITGGLLRVIQQRAASGELQRPSELVRELTRWARSYYPMPNALASVDSQAIGEIATLQAPRVPIGGRAPGTLSLTPKRMPESASRVSPSFTAHSQRERILDAVATLCASKGYVALTVDEIVALASVSLNTFYEHFKDKEDAFLVAHELGHVRATAALEQTLALAPSWDTGVRDGIAALLGFFFSEPSFARMAAIEAPIASPQTAARAAVHLATYAQLLLDGAPRSRRPPNIAEAAIAASLHAAVFAYAVHGVIRDPVRAHSYATYLALAPFLGPNKAFTSAANTGNSRASTR